MSNLKLSIITINFNNATGLRKTIESVIVQTSAEFEYIIIDGGSTDGSVDVIKQYHYKLAYWVSEPDRGIYHAMNKGIAQAKGEYCQFLNSGDCLAQKDVTQKMLDNMPDTSILIGNMIKQVSKDKTILDRGTSHEKPTFFTFYKGTLNHSPAYIRRNLFNKYGLYDETLKIVSDWKWYLIAVGLNNEKVFYKNIDVTLFDMSGISNLENALVQKERRSVLKELIPAAILIDYDAFWYDMFKAKRLKKHRYLYSLLNNSERLIFKITKVLNGKKSKVSNHYIR